MTKSAAVQVDIPCNVQQIDETGLVWTLLDGARGPGVIVPGATVHRRSLGDTPRGNPPEYVEALSRAHLLSA